MITYSLTDTGIFHVQFTDHISFSDVIDYLNEFGKIGDLPDKIILLYDLRKADMHIQLSEIVAISRLARKVTLKYQSVKTAFLVESPGITAYVMMFIMQAVKSKNIRKVFSTEDAAYRWLND